ncbi:MAG: flagellar motor switch protein FliN, partial [Bryobacteraceae bacterium]
FPASAIVYAGATAANAILLGGKVLEAAGVEASPEDARGTYLETLNQALSGLGQSLTARLGKESTCKTGDTGPAPGEKATGTASFQITLAGQVNIELFAGFNAEMLAALEPDTKAAKQAAAAASGPSAAVAGVPAALPVSQGPARTMDLLYDVELPVSVSFGRAQLPLKDVIKLTSGSIVELNRSVTEPVEIIVNNCVIARGEVVVIEGNYGVRIDQIISRQERLRTLR